MPRLEVVMKRVVRARFRPALLALAAGTAPTLGQGISPVYLQWWELKWTDMEHRTPDFFVSGYGALWLPPIHKAASTNSVGYDVWDRFDIGRPGAETAYGTQESFRAVVDELHAANGLVNIDIVMNHNSGRNTSYAFHAAGGYPGFWTGPLPAVNQNKRADSDWGDFHNGIGASTYYQSENPSGPNYDLHRGDLVALTDIAQESNHQFIRHPIQAGNPQNIPAGTSVNLPDPTNRRMYRDLQLSPQIVNNPGTTRNPGATQFTLHPFNAADPMQGDPVPDNGTGLLMRWTQWTLDVLNVDGFRIDAIKHTPSWFFDTFWDAVVHLRRTTPWGAKVTPYSFGESVESNSFTYNNYVRKDAFGNRDALDLNGAGQLRNVVNAGGLGSWASVLPAHLDNQDDGLNNGSLGVNHVFSHDNGSTTGSPPPDPSYQQQGWAAHAYLLMRTGPAIVYHNARGITRPAGGFWPGQGTPVALGLDPTTNAANPVLTRLVQLHNWYGRGEFGPLNGTSSPAVDDVFIFERRRNNGGGNFSANVLVGVNDRYDGGFDSRTITTSFPQGTILKEMTGNAIDPIVDPNNDIFDTVTVGAGGSVTIRVPRNRNASNVAHHKGFVVYGPAVPEGQVSVSPMASVIPADDAAIPHWRRRLTSVPVVTSPSFALTLITTQAQAGDPGTDNNAVLRINQGFQDLNGNGIVDKPPTDPVVPGYENFLTVNQPLFNSGQSSGTYSQTIDTSLLPEGYNYISVIAFRQRPSNTDPLFREFRQVIYVDRTGPAVEWMDAGTTITSAAHQFRIRFLDRTANRMHLFLNLPPGSDPVALSNITNQGTRHDRFEWRMTLTDLSSGQHTLTIVAFEDSGNASITTYPVNVDRPCYANCDSSTSFPRLTANDFQCFLNRFAAGDTYANCDNSTGSPLLTANDFQCYLNAFAAGCP
jgi:glycosidase